MNKIIFPFALLVLLIAYTHAVTPQLPLRPHCLKLPCDNPSKKLLCVRSQNGNCQLLTICEVSRINCDRGPQNVLIRVHSRQCTGMKHGQRLLKCNRGL